nr:pyrophosphatase [Psychromicrobium silvestre]
MQESLEEVSVRYAEVFEIDRTETWFVLKLQEELGELVQAFLAMKGMARTRGRTEEELRGDFAQECADVLAHFLLLAKHEGVDLETAIQQKWLSRLEKP